MAKKAPSSKKAESKAGAKRKPSARAEEPGIVATAAPVSEFTPICRILGQDRAVKTLRSAVESGHVHHAWVFVGPPGVGKFTAAMAFAAILLDPEAKANPKDAFEGEAETPTVRSIRAGAHPDVQVVRKEMASFSSDPDVRKSKQTGIALEVMREFFIVPAARTRQVQADSLAGKVLIVDEAHLLQREGQNAVLKTLEEPPAGTVIILVTSNEERLLPTVRSRCQRAVFVPLDDEAMNAWLRRRGLPAPLPAWLAGYASGAPGAVAWALEFGLEPWHERVAEGMRELSKGKYRHDLSLTMAALLDAIKEKLAAEHDQASKELAGHHASERVMRVIAGIARERLRAEGEHAEGWATCIEAVAQAEGYIRRNVQPGFVFENLVATMGRAPVRA